MGVRERTWLWLWLLSLALSFGGRPARAGAPPSEPDVETVGTVETVETAETAETTKPDGAEAVVAAPLELALPDDPERMRLIWRPASVAWPLAPLSSGADDYAQLAAWLEQRQAMLEGRAPTSSVRGPVELDAGRAVGVWLAALETIRVRQIGEPVPLRFIRGVDGNVAVREPGRAVADGPGGERRWELHQPPSVGAVWSIEADAPTTVIIERVEERPARYVSVEVEYDVLRWIGHVPPKTALGPGKPARRLNDAPTLPSLLEPDDDLARRLRLHAALAEELDRVAGGDRKLAAGLTAWRGLAAQAELDRQRPAVKPYYMRESKRERPIRLDDAQPIALATEQSRDYQLAKQPRSWTIARRGPGQLRIAARTWAGAGQSLQAAELRVYAGGVLIERLPLSDRQARHSLDPETALPQLVPLLTAAGDVVGEFAAVNVVTAPGQHDYVIELVGGPAMIEIEGAVRTEASLLSRKGWTPSKRARAGKRALAKTHAPERIWLELLLSRSLAEPLPIHADDPRLDALAARSPLLAVAALGMIAAERTLDDAQFFALAERVRPWLSRLASDASVDPLVRGQLRAQWLQLAAVHGRGQLVELLTEQPPGGADPLGELPLAGLRTLAELLLPTALTVRSPALAVLELARTRAPADEGLREQTLRLWTAASRWSRRRPVAPVAELPLTPAGEWLVARETMPADPSELLDSWLRLEVGVPVRVRAELGPDAIRREFDGEALVDPGQRARLLDVYVSTPIGDPEPVMLRVDDQRWWSPMLFGVQRHRVVVAEGVHELELDGPPETVAWAELPPADEQREPGEIGRRERMWPLGVSLWPLPGPAVPGVVRLELRWPANVEPRPVRITMHELGDHPPGQVPPDKLVVFDPRTGAAAAGQAPAGQPPMIIDSEATPISGSPWASPRHDLSLTISASTTSLSFDVEDNLEIAGSLSLRRGMQPRDFADGNVDPLGVNPPPPSHDQVFDGLAALDGAGMLAELRGLSRVLMLTPDDLERRARRAALLLMFGETGHARADLVRLTAWAARDDIEPARRELAEQLLRALERRFEALIEPREIVVASGRALTPTLVEPALAAVVGADRVMLEPHLERWAQLRDKPTDEALVALELELLRLRDARARGQEPDVATALLLTQLTRAHWLSHDRERTREAGRAWLELYGRTPGHPGTLREPLAIALAAVEPLLAHLDDPTSDARDAGLAFGLARALAPAYGHTSVRRLAFVAALRSDWSTIDHSEHNSGFERLELPIAEIELTPAAQVRDALMVAPWPRSEAEELRPGRKGVLAWDAVPGRLRAEFWCRVARPDLSPQRAHLVADPSGLGAAKLSLRLRGDARTPTDIQRELSVEDGVVSSIELPIDRKARHRFEVVLDSDPVWLCSWRTSTSTGTRKRDEDGEVVEARRRALWWTADSTTEVELVLLGPASLDLQSRVATNPDPGKQTSQLIASVERLDAGRDQPAYGNVRERGELRVDGARERAVITESRRSFDVAHQNGHTLLLTDAAPYRVRVRTDRGRTFVRARVRRDRGDVPPPTQFSIREIEPVNVLVAEGFDWRSVGPARPVIARDEIEPVRNRIGSLDARVRVGLDDIADVDSFEPRLGMLARVGWRRELIDNSIWLVAWAQAAVRAQSPPAFGGIVRFGSQVPVLGLRLGAEIDVLAGSFAGRPAASMRLFGFVDRPIALGRRWQLRPGLTAGVRWQSLSPAQVAAAPGRLEPHPRLYLKYIEDHPLLLRPELELRAFVFQDMAVWLQAELMPNSDLRGLDNVNVELGFDGIGRVPRPWVPIWGGSYQASTRLADADRSATQLRHRIDAELGLGVWARDIVRVAFGLANQLYLTQAFGGAALDELGVRDVVELWIRIDGTWGRRMRDYGPGELWFAEPWAPRSFADDEHQARSSQGR